MEHPPNRRELVAMFMESPFYFELYLRERLLLVQRHQQRFSPPPAAESAPSGLANGKPLLVCHP